MNHWLSHRQGRASCRGNGRVVGRFCRVWQLTRWGLRGPWRAIVHGVARVGHDLATKPPPLKCAISSLGKTKRRNHAASSWIWKSRAKCATGWKMSLPLEQELHRDHREYAEGFYTILNSESKSCSVTLDSVGPHGLYSPWNSPGQNIGVGSLSFSRDLPNPGIKPRSPALQADSLPAELPGKPNIKHQFSSVQSLSRVRLFGTPWTIQSVEFSRPKYWSG